MGHCSRPCKGCSISVCLHSFTRNLVRWKYMAVTFSLLFILSTSVICVVFFQVPDLSNPFVDFVTIGTDWSARTQQFQALLAETSSNPDYLVHSDLIWIKQDESNFTEIMDYTNETHHDFVNRFRRVADTNYFEREFCLEDTGIQRTESTNSLWNVYAKYSRIVFSMNYDQILKMPNRSAIIYKLSNSMNNTILSDAVLLFAVLSDLCKLQMRLSRLSTYQQLCYKKIGGHKNDKHLFTADNQDCCSIWCLSNMIASVFGKKSCEALTDADAQKAAEIITVCYPTFVSGHLRRSCWDNYGTDPNLLCPMVKPSQCLYSPILPIILAALLPDDGETVKTLDRTLMVLPIRATGSHLLFDEIENECKSGRLTTGLQIPFYLKSMYIQEYDEIVTHLLSRDISWLLISLVCLVILLTLWTRTIFIPILTVMAIIWSLLIAYSIYTVVLKIPHFPIINLLAIVLVTGLGADDLLVFYQVWKEKRNMLVKIMFSQTCDEEEFKFISHLERQELMLSIRNELNLSSSLNNNHFIPNRHCSTNEIHLDYDYCIQNSTLNNEQLVECLHFTLLHAIPPMTLTTISTLSGLLVNLFSSIVAVQRFTIFASLVITCNYIFVFIVTVPTIVILEFYCISIQCLIPRYFYKCYQVIFKKCLQLTCSFNRLIINLHFVFPFVIILTLSFTSYQLLWLHRFDIPHDHQHSSAFLRTEHPLEVFLYEDVNTFQTERDLHYYQNLLKINFIWGPKPYDDRSMFKYNHDVYSNSKLLLHSSTNFTSINSRLWLSTFCKEVKHMPFLFQSLFTNYRQDTLSSFEVSYLNPSVNMPVWCPFGRYINSIDNFIFSQDCLSSVSSCCMNGKPLLVYNSSTSSFIHCLYEYVSHEEQQHHLSGFRFMNKKGIHFKEPIGFTVHALTNISLISSSHQHLQQTIHTISIWFQSLLLNAPESLRHGFIAVPELEKYEIMHNVTQYVYQSIIIAVLIASLLILIISKSIILSLLSLLCLTCCLMLSITILVCLDNWTLGMIEGLIISLAAGLAIDPCIHLAYAVFDKENNKKSNRCQLLIWSCNDLMPVLTSLGPAITGSAWTSAIIGLPIIFSNLLCYHQIGVFLSTLMFCSWFFCYIVFSGLLVFVNNVINYFKYKRVLVISILLFLL
ncbi:unnamed protein product [Heterobilharzia americana]|nr:unnamed protein product [Heterobilharzia americana]